MRIFARFAWFARFAGFAWVAWFGWFAWFAWFARFARFAWLKREITNRIFIRYKKLVGIVAWNPINCINA
jgi:hypothetical protein